MQDSKQASMKASMQVSGHGSKLSGGYLLMAVKVVFLIMNLIQQLNNASKTQFQFQF